MSTACEATLIYYRGVGRNRLLIYNGFLLLLQCVKDGRSSSSATIGDRPHELCHLTGRDTGGGLPEHAEVHAEQEQAAARGGERAHVV